MSATKVKKKQIIRIIIKSFDHRLADDAVKVIIDTLETTGAIISGPIPLPTKIKKYTVNRATFKSSKSKEQFEIRTHKRLIEIVESTPKTVECLQNLALSSGVDVEIKMKQ